MNNSTGAGQLWTWLQNIVGVSNQLSWIAIGIASLRFRAGIKRQGLEHLLPYKNWTYPYGPLASIILNSVLVLVQGWKSFSPSFSPVDFVSFYIELPVMLVMFVGWKLLKKTRWVRLEEMDLVTDRFDVGMSQEEKEVALRKAPRWKGLTWRERALAAGTSLFL
jgi:AAT family amino acid transporter